MNGNEQSDRHGCKQRRFWRDRNDSSTDFRWRRMNRRKFNLGGKKMSLMSDNCGQFRSNRRGW